MPVAAVGHAKGSPKPRDQDRAFFRVSAVDGRRTCVESIPRWECLHPMPGSPSVLAARAGLRPVCAALPDIRFRTEHLLGPDSSKSPSDLACPSRAGDLGWFCRARRAVPGRERRGQPTVTGRPASRLERRARVATPRRDPSRACEFRRDRPARGTEPYYVGLQHIPSNPPHYDPRDSRRGPSYTHTPRAITT